MISADRFAVSLLERLDHVTRALTAARWPDLSPFWRATLDRFVRSGVRQLVARVGRRGGKSSTACIFAVAFALSYAPLGLVPPGDVGWVVFVSVRREEALSRLRTIEAILGVLRIPFDAADGDAIIIRGTNLGFRVQSCTVAAVSGWTSILVVADEVAKWSDADTGANPATEVLSALRPTLATQPLGRLLLVSSPLGPDDAHARAFDDGDTAFQLVVHAPSWVANPSIAEADTRAWEPDDRVWRREYAAQAQAGALAAFDPDAIARAFTPRGAPDRQGTPVLVVDPSSGRKDAWTWAVVRSCSAGSARWLRFSVVDGLSGSFWRTVTAADLVERVARLAADVGAREVHADQREAFALSSAFQAHGLTYHVHDWTASSKTTAVERVRRWLADSAVELADHDQLRRELLRFEERITPSGALTFAGRGSGHDDYVALLITAAMAEQAGTFDAAPGDLAAVLGRYASRRPDRDAYFSRWPGRGY